VFDGDERWQGVETATGHTFTWDDASTYVLRPPFLEGIAPDPSPVHDIAGARVLAVLGVILGVADWLWMSRRTKNQMKMSPSDMKEDMRKEEGSPEAKRARRKAALNLRRSRMQGNPARADAEPASLARAGRGKP